MMPPALRTLATLRSSSRGTWSLNSSEPQVVRRPAVACRSLRPTAGRRAAPDPRRAGWHRRWPWPAGAPASASMATMALTAGLVASMRARQLSSSSSGDSLPRADHAPRLHRRQIASLAHDDFPRLCPRRGECIAKGSARLELVAADRQTKQAIFPPLTVFVTGRLAYRSRYLAQFGGWRRGSVTSQPASSTIEANFEEDSTMKLLVGPGGHFGDRGDPGARPARHPRKR